MDYPILKLRILPQTYAICSFPPEHAIPGWAQSLSIVSITRTPEELTIVCEEDRASGDCRMDRNWRCIKVDGSFDLDAVGVLAGISGPLAGEKISIYVVSTFDTDYIPAHGEHLARAVSTLSKAGHTLVDSIESGKQSGKQDIQR